MKIWKPIVGQTVVFTETGLKQIHGLRSEKEVRAQIDGFKIVRVSKAHTIPECWNIEVDGLFSNLILTSIDVKLK